MDDTYAFSRADRPPLSGMIAPILSSEAQVAEPLKLVLLPGGMSIELKKPDVLVGRHTAADVRLPLSDISRRHCRLIYTAGGWQVLDLGSLNGVFVNDRRVRQAALSHRDRIRIGSLVFEVRLRAAGLGLSPARRAS
jgi:pSer/pThr/pTyr-binding forkhead associated (FHA) protein